MKITFDAKDRQLVAGLLKELEVGITPARIESILYNVTAAYQQQLYEEAQHMIETFELGG